MDGQALALLQIKSGKEREPDLNGRGRKLKVERLDRTWRTYVSRTCDGKRSSAETLPCSGHPEVEENAVVILERPPIEAKLSGPCTRYFPSLFFASTTNVAYRVSPF